MRLSPPIDPRARPGYALLITLVFITTSLMTLSSLMWWASSNGTITQKNELFTDAESAADAATEQVVANLDFDWTGSQGLQSASHYANLTLPNQSAWPVKFQYSDGSGNIGLTGVTIAISNYFAPVGSQFAGLSGYILPCTITSTATTSNQTYSVSATVQQVVHATLIPLFQFAIFYNMNLEIDPGAGMTLTGPVYSNQGIWSGTPNVSYKSTVAAVQNVFYLATNGTSTDPWMTGKTDSGTPDGNFAFTPESGADSLNLPIGNGTNNSPAAVEAIINLPTGTNGAPNPWAYTTNGQTYMFNASDLIISNSANGFGGTEGTNLTIWYQDPANTVTPLTQISNDFYVVTNRGTGTTYTTNYVAPGNTNIVSAGFSFVTNVSYYDFRESDTVQAVQVDVSKLNVWLTNTSTTGGNSINRTSFHDNAHGIRSIYVYNKVPTTGSQLPAVRMINGAQLPYTVDPNGTGLTTGGLTVSTPQPIYVEGNYNVQTASSTAQASAGTTNTAYTYPAALLGDAVTVLSGKWSDSYASTTTCSTRTTPTATTVNAACLEGIVESTNSNYSGGVENFLRMEENWNGVNLTYNGSIVVMFPSIYATNFWPGTGTVYNPPNRNWAFDLNFTNPNKLPPLSPKIYRIIRSSWKDY